MNLTSQVRESLLALLGMFALPLEFVGETAEEALTSAQEVNIILGFTDGLRGSVVLGLSRQSAKVLVGCMMGSGAPVELDEMGKSALGELGNMLAGMVMGKLEGIPTVNLAPPSLVLGEEVLLLISWVPSARLRFISGELPIDVTYAVE